MHTLLLCWLVCLAAAPTASPKQYAEFLPCEWPQLDTAVQHFSEILQFHTVSNASHPLHADPVVWGLLDMWMRDAYPDVFSALSVEQLGAGNLSYLFTWQGQRELDPVLFVSHTDVVPVAEETLKDWTHPPFEGAVADGFVWGRGAMDAKVLVVLLLEAASALLSEGFKPQRTLLFAFGHDEEVRGTKGAAMIAAELASRGIKLEVVVDEGSSIVMDGIAPLYSSPVAVVSTAEKAYMQVEVTLSSKGGHSSMPPIDGSSIGARLGRFLSAMQSHPGRAELVAPTSDFVAELGRLAPAGVWHLIGSAPWLPPVRWLLARLLARVQAETAAMVYTTAAVTKLVAGTAANVLPQSVTIGLNFRLLPGHRLDTVLQLVRRWLGRDLPYAEITVQEDDSAEVAVADMSGPHFAVMRAAVQQTWKLDQPGSRPLPVLPLLMPGMTDSRHYARLSPHGALRFTPWTSRKADGDYNRVHGVDERVRVADCACALNMYKALMTGFSTEALGSDGAAAGVAGDRSEL